MSYIHIYIHIIIKHDKCPKQLKGYKAVPKNKKCWIAVVYDWQFSGVGKILRKRIYMHVLLAERRRKKRVPLRLMSAAKKEVKLASWNFIWPTVTWLLEAPPINPKKGRLLCLVPPTVFLYKGVQQSQYLSEGEIVVGIISVGIICRVF